VVACESLTSLEIPGAVGSIGDYAFYDCFNVTNLSLPGSLTNIGNNTFCSCTKLPKLAEGRGHLKLSEATRSN
jgi:hypothetical protein